MADYFDLIASRESCRNFLERPVEKEKLIRCAEAARIAPSACDSQPWEFIVVNGGPLRGKVAECAQQFGLNKFTQKAPAFVAVVEKKAMLRNPAGMVADQKYAKFDLGLATMQFCLAATAQGLSTCILGSINRKKLKELPEIGEDIFVLIAVGYAADSPLRRKQRKGLDEILKFAE